MRRAALGLLALLFLASCRQAPPAEAIVADPLPATPERIRLAQLFVSKARNDDELREELRAIRGTGANVVVIRAFHLRGDSYHRLTPEGAPEVGVYFRSEGSPLVADVLPSFVKAAHAEGLHAWGWMTTRYCGWLLEGVPDGAEYRRVGHDLKRGPALDLFNPEAIQALEGLYRDLGASGVDGVLFQDDLVLRGGDGFGPHAAEVLGPGALALGELRAPDWYPRRAAHLVHVGEGLAGAARTGAGREIAVAWNVYYDELWVPDKALEWLSRDVSLAGRARFDYLVVMAYHRQVARELQLGGDDLRSALATMARRLEAEVLDAPSRAVVKLQAVDWRTGEAIPLDELRWAAEPWLETAPFSLGIARIEALEGVRFEELEAGVATP